MSMDDTRWVKTCWMEKRTGGWSDLHGREREKYYNRNEWGIVAMVDGMAREKRDIRKELIVRNGAVQRQEEEGMIERARYNVKYREIQEEGTLLRYLEQLHLRSEINGEGIRALMRTRWGNIEEGYKY